MAEEDVVGGHDGAEQPGGEEHRHAGAPGRAQHRGGEQRARGRHQPHHGDEVGQPARVLGALEDRGRVATEIVEVDVERGGEHDRREDRHRGEPEHHGDPQCEAAQIATGLVGPDPVLTTVHSWSGDR